jgi:hypothetical protein
MYRVLSLFEKHVHEIVQPSATQALVGDDVEEWHYRTLVEALEDIRQGTSQIIRLFDFDKFIQLVQNNTIQVQEQPDDEDLKQSRAMMWLIFSAIAGNVVEERSSQDLEQLLQHCVSVRDMTHPNSEDSSWSQSQLAHTDAHGSFPALTPCLDWLVAASTMTDS